MPINKPPLLVCLKGGRLVSLIDIKPQHNPNNTKSRYVVLYLSSTSNHNDTGVHTGIAVVVLYLSSTSNHNTSAILRHRSSSCVISFFYIKPQRRSCDPPSRRRCVISFFYIKPQPWFGCTKNDGGCVISFFYIKPQRELMKARLCESCVISFFYIKPQRPTRNGYSKTVVLYLSSTSNHNNWIVILSHTCVVLYLSSTSNHNGTAAGKTKQMLCYIFLLHQTTTVRNNPTQARCCVISFFYIKPQLASHTKRRTSVVLYLSSTSNHNNAPVHIEKSNVVLYLSSTSNHNNRMSTIFL